MGTEIERKFRLKSLPSFVLNNRGLSVRQGYLLAGKRELRVREMGSVCYLTFKGQGTLKRREWERKIPRWAFRLLYIFTAGRRVEKVRRRISFDGLVLEVDEYFGHLSSLVTMECEFPGEGEAYRAFRLPAWADGALEVTNDKAYKNKNLAKNGLPD